MKTVCIVQARIGSTRLPGKVLLPLNGHTIIGEVLTRCKRISGVDEVVCAVPEGENALIAEVMKYCGAVQGPEADVLTRYVVAAEVTGADVIMRITGDCPLISPELCGAVLDLHHRARADYTSNILPRTFPKGLDCEVFTREMLESADECKLAHDREHVTPWMQQDNLWGIQRANLTSPWPIDGRLCLDTEDDYKVICAAFGHEPHQHLQAA